MVVSRRRVVALILVLGLIAATGIWAEAIEDQPGWKEKSNKDGIRIFNREREGSEIKELLALTEIDRPIWRIAAALGDYDGFKDFMPYTVVSKNLKSEAVSPTETVNYFFTALDLPLVSNRYYTLRLVDEWNPDGEQGAFRSQWKLSTDPDPAWDDPMVKDLFPDGFKKPVKTPLNNGFWLLEPQAHGATKITYYVFTDPGGAIPSFIANQANSVAVPKLMKALRERSADPRYDSMAPGK